MPPVKAGWMDNGDTSMLCSTRLLTTTLETSTSYLTYPRGGREMAEEDRRWARRDLEKDVWCLSSEVEEDEERTT